VSERSHDVAFRGSAAIDGVRMVVPSSPVVTCQPRSQFGQFAVGAVCGRLPTVVVVGPVVATGPPELRDDRRAGDELTVARKERSWLEK
jgi:hypothetical protein